MGPLRLMTQDLAFESGWEDEALAELSPLLSPEHRAHIGAMDVDRRNLVLAAASSAAMLLRSLAPDPEVPAEVWASSVLEACDLVDAIGQDPLMRELAAHALEYGLSVDGLPALSMPMYMSVCEVLARLGLVAGSNGGVLHG